MSRSGEMLSAFTAQARRINQLHWLMVVSFALVIGFGLWMTHAARVELSQHGQLAGIIVNQQKLFGGMVRHIREVARQQRQGIDSQPAADLARASLSETTKALSATQEVLSRQFSLRRLRQHNQALYRIYYQSPYRLSDRLDRFIRYAESLVGSSSSAYVDGPSRTLDIAAPEHSEIADALSAALSQSIVTRDRATRHYQRQMEIALIMCLAIAVVTLLTLLRPALRRLVGHHDRIVSLHSELVQRTLSDTQTGFCNRSGLAAALSPLLAQATGRGERMVLFAMRIINLLDAYDGLDIQQEEKIVSVMAERLRSLFPHAHVIGRLGTREFAIVPKCSTSKDELSSQAAGIIDAIQRPIALSERLWTPVCRVGGIVFPDDANNVSDLMRDVELALSDACQREHDNVAYFVPSLRQQCKGDQAFIDDIAFGLDSGQFCNFYLPVVDLHSRGHVGLEALVRWNHPRRGLLAPDAFLVAAQAGGLIGEITDRVLDNVARHCRDWASLSLSPVHISVNVADQVFVEEQFAIRVGQLAETLSQCGTTLSVEIRESAFFDHGFAGIEAAAANMKAAGAGLILDDFGMGNVSLAKLLRLGCDEVKIDRACTARLSTSQQARTLVSTMLAVINDLRLRSVAEGVESESQRRILLRLGCQLAQGALFASPMPADAVREYLAHWRDGIDVPDDYLHSELAVDSV